ncbi:MAG: hypothetical protein J6W39_05155, partial [Spirochaetales bacterium]|nr:hypothetical protein [Spirochaetales bacterium]
MDLKAYIEENNISIASHSKETGLPYTPVSELVNGKKSLGKCSAETVYRLAKGLQTTVEGLLLSEGGSTFSDRFSLDRKQSLFLSKELWDEN